MLLLTFSSPFVIFRFPVLRLPSANSKRKGEMLPFCKDFSRLTPWDGQQSGKNWKIRAFRGKSPRKARQVPLIGRQVAASHSVICGDFPVFSTTALPGKPCLWAFRAAWCGKSAFFLP